MHTDEEVREAIKKNERYVFTETKVADIDDETITVEVRVYKSSPMVDPETLAIVKEDYQEVMYGHAYKLPLKEFEMYAPKAQLVITDYSQLREHLSEAYKTITELRSQVAELKRKSK
jgi:hypothetical protein